MLRINQKLLDMPVKTTAGDFSLHDYYKNYWGLMVCYVSDFSAVCTNELSRLAMIHNKLEKRGVKTMAMSCDSMDFHIKWTEDLKKLGEIKDDEDFPFPIVSDCNRMLSIYLSVLDQKCVDQDGIPVPCRATFIFAPDLSIQLMHFYPQTTGRNIDELMRTIDALKLSFKSKERLLTPCDWKPTSTSVLLSEKLSKLEIDKFFPTSKLIILPSGKEYYRCYEQVKKAT
ncbi:peroxiredoxin-6-like [Daktulosphaira vitifoliae]|uniref:peroxiredoxin-6-like n=1 Tax=Daktulosphaira vitifoliae TaxID=58002 RepID=UPI0021A9EC2A|nr:peroxiredoxin-6-like [Daktulosphaira vitifoliae]